MKMQYAALWGLFDSKEHDEEMKSQWCQVKDQLVLCEWHYHLQDEWLCAYPLPSASITQTHTHILYTYSSFAS